MIKNIIFDLGNVLIKYSPESFLEKNVKKERQEKFIATVFKSKEWLELDRGTLSYEDAIEKFAEIIPEDRENLEKLFKNNIMDCLAPIEENIEILKKLKKKGYNLFVLSNFHRPAFEQVQKEWEFFDEFDGGVISCYCHLLKPNQRIYELLLARYGLIPEETLFIDDTKINVEKAEKIGMEGIYLDLPEMLEKLLKKKGIEV
ncbi:MULTISPECIES: HAD family hydrolase [Fusobacterium]|jgi:putative hydrolase of the HAD superfamily|uniref:HAD family hydrolase n=1 Tax=Fusobacterium TaxID=848 RepID=UPI000E4A16E8|nr:MULTISPECIES: HAD family phosphatase [Fusobacterium]RHG34403.1 HAD family phosphatase [Fusobacterium varium]HBJ78280.1 HAD family phosphatase [Fusobacterium sp.]